MNSNITFSLSLQKQIQIQNQTISIDTELNRAFSELNFRSLLKRNDIIDVFIRFAPFLKRKLTDFWSSKCLENQIEA